jgi:hypothetical protein
MAPSLAPVRRCSSAAPPRRKRAAAPAQLRLRATARTGASQTAPVHSGAVKIASGTRGHGRPPQAAARRRHQGQGRRHHLHIRCLSITRCCGTPTSTLGAWSTQSRGADCTRTRFGCTLQTMCAPRYCCCGPQSGRTKLAHHECQRTANREVPGAATTSRWCGRADTALLRGPPLCLPLALSLRGVNYLAHCSKAPID